MNVLDFIKKKQNQEKISMLTCYDYTSAKILASTSVDCLLVGDSVAMTMHGYTDTISATLDMMKWHTQAVRRGAASKFIITDLPFLSYRKSLSKNVSAAEQLMQAGANALKLECAQGNTKLIKHLTESGIPIMGHLGLTPQSMHGLGGFRVQGKTPESRDVLMRDALALEQAGAFAIVLECVPAAVAKEVTAALKIPTIGIGAGPDTDGQVLVFQDVLGLNLDFKPKFVKAYCDGSNLFKAGIEQFIKEMQAREFPQYENSF